MKSALASIPILRDVLKSMHDLREKMPWKRRTGITASNVCIFVEFFSQLMDVLISMYPAALRLEIFKLTQNFLDLISTYGTSGKRALKVSHNTLCWNM